MGNLSQERHEFRDVPLVMHYLLLKEGGANTEDPDAKLQFALFRRQPRLLPLDCRCEVRLAAEASPLEAGLKEWASDRDHRVGNAYGSTTRRPR